MNIRHYLNSCYTQSPQTIFNKLKRRVRQDLVLQYSEQEIYSPKNQRSQRLLIFLVGMKQFCNECTVGIN